MAAQNGTGTGAGLQATASETGVFDPDAVTKLVILAEGSGTWDRIRFEATPEPSTALMMLGGLLGLGMVGRRRQG